MTDEEQVPTYVNNLDDGEDEPNETYLSNTRITETAGFQPAKDGDTKKSATNNNGAGTIETVGVEAQKDRVNEENVSHLSNTGMAATVGFETIKDNEMESAARQLLYIFSLVGDELEHILVAIGPKERIVDDQPDKQNEIFQRTISALEKMKQIQQDIKRFEDENRCLESLLSCLHKHISTGTEANNISFELSGEIPPESAVSSCYNAAQSIWDKFMKMKGDMKRFEDENRWLDSLLSCLNKHISTGREGNTIYFEVPSEISPESAVYSSYNAAQSIWDKFMKMKGSKEKTKNTNKKLLNSVEDMNRSLTRKSEKVTKLRNSEMSLLSELKSIDAVKKQLHNDCQTLQSRIEQLTDEKEQCEQIINMMKEQIENYQQNEVHFKAAYDAEVMKTENQKRQIDGLQLKSAELLNRLSKLAGDRLTHENTNITDLSDPNRPIKLAESYSELYDNEWTDAFEELINCNLTEEAAVRTLCEMLLASFHKCREITWERYRSLVSIVSTIDISVLACVRVFSKAHDPDTGSRNTGEESEIIYKRTEVVGLTPQSKETHITCTTTMNHGQEKEIKRIWRTTTTALQDEAVKRMHSVLLTMFDISIDEFPKTSKYLNICIDLCWKMGIQERPMHLDAVVETNDGSEKIFDLNKFRPYTKTGNRVAFVVWPALFLHEGGAMLVKGIAQGCKETDKCNVAMHT